MENLRTVTKKYAEIIAYLFWGVMSTIVSWGSYSVIIILLDKQHLEVVIYGMKLSIVISNMLSWLCAVIFAFITNKLWVFQSKSWKYNIFFSELAKFLSARVFTGILELAAVPLLVWAGMNQTLFGIEGIVAKIIVSVAVVVLNYIFSKLFIFKNELGRND